MTDPAPITRTCNADLLGAGLYLTSAIARGERIDLGGELRVDVMKQIIVRERAKRTQQETTNG